MINEDAERLFLKQTNLFRAQVLLDSLITNAARMNARLMLNEDVLKRFHRVAMQGLLFAPAQPGEYRCDDVEITNSPHMPPSWINVNALMQDFFRYIEMNWAAASLTHLAAFTMWRLNWIHPFSDGNGRTSRVASYFVLCAKHGALLPVKNSILDQLTDARVKRGYYEALRACDGLAATQHSIPDCVAPLEALLTDLLKDQLRANL
jgi:Fic family protein